MTEKKPKIPDGYEPTPDGGLRLVKPETCGNGHTPVRPGWGLCPKCRNKMTMVFSCFDPRCDGALPSAEHRKECQPTSS